MALSHLEALPSSRKPTRFALNLAWKIPVTYSNHQVGGHQKITSRSTTDTGKTLLPTLGAFSEGCKIKVCQGSRNCRGLVV
eukprot:1873373-Amphidinium_carterae.1